MGKDASLDPQGAQIVACDAGGTMTDVIVVDRAGSFAIGKAATTPDSQATGFCAALDDAFGPRASTDPATNVSIAGVEACVYSGTSMLNALLTGTGRRVGVITHRGEEDIFLHQRSRQTWAGYGVADLLHHVAHHRPRPLVSRRLTKGVTGRIDMFGVEAIPLYEDEVRNAVAELLAEDVEAIAVCLMFSYLNPAHEERLAELAREVIAGAGDPPVTLHLSHELAPIIREQGRLNTVVLHAAAAEPCRRQLLGIEGALRNRDYRHPLQVLLSHGGVADIRYQRLHESTFSGPIGGLLGARYLSSVTGIDNWVCADMGGTSFDVGLIMGGEPMLDREVTVTRRLFNLPTLVMDTVGAGMGMYVSIDPLTQRITLGPGSAGAEPGPVCYDLGNETPTVMDCALVTGLLNPHNYLGGKVELNTSMALKALREKCADPLGVDVHYLAEGVLDLVTSSLREHIRTVLGTRGFSAADYSLLAYGGAGPLLMAGYSSGLPFRGVATLPSAAGFSAFGAAAVDLTHRYQKSSGIIVPDGADDDWKVGMGELVNLGWDELEERARADLSSEGLDWAAASVQPLAYVRYGGQMEDLEVPSPVPRIGSAADMDALIAAFEALYERIYAEVAKHPQAGYHILELGLTVTIPKVKPRLTCHPLQDPTPTIRAVKGQRDVYHGRRWRPATLYDMDALQPGNEVEGMAVIEAPATTLFVPPGHRVRMDEWSMLWLTSGDDQQ